LIGPTKVAGRFEVLRDEGGVCVGTPTLDGGSKSPM
jgi:hypothetical protein